MATIEYDDSNLQRMFAAMDPGQRLKALKGAFRKEATRVRKTAVNNLRGSGIRTDKDLEKGIRQTVFKREAGFCVTIKPKRSDKAGGKDYGFHKNRQGLKKPILTWAEEGTKERRTKSKTRIFVRTRKGHPTGRMKRYGFMRQTRDQVVDTVNDNLHNEIVASVTKIAAKYGCS